MDKFEIIRRILTDPKVLKIVKYLFAVASIVALFCVVDFHDIWLRLRHVNFIWFSVAFTLLLLNSVQQAMRWRQMLGKPEIPVSKYLFFVFVGHYSSLFVPSQLGADAIKGYAFGKKYGDVGVNIGVQLANRISGVIALFLFSAFGLLLYWPKLMRSGICEGVRVESEYLILFSVGLAVGTIALWWVLRRSTQSWVAPVRAMLTNVTVFRTMMFYSILIQITSSLALYANFSAIVTSPDFGMIVFFTSIAQVLLLFPVSVGGVGIREWILVVLFSKIGGVPANDVIAVSLLGYVYLLLLAAMGGVWMSFRAVKVKS